MLVIRRLSALLFLPGLSLFGASNPQLSKTLATLPVRFEANAGQHNSKVRFTARTDGYSLFFTNRDVVFVASEAGSKAITISLENGMQPPLSRALSRYRRWRLFSLGIRRIIGRPT